MEYIYQDLNRHPFMAQSYHNILEALEWLAPTHVYHLDKNELIKEHWEKNDKEEAVEEAPAPEGTGLAGGWVALTVPSLHPS